MASWRIGINPYWSHPLPHLHALIGHIQLCIGAAGNDAADQQGVWLVTHLEHILLVDQAKATVGGLRGERTHTFMAYSMQRHRVQQTQ